MRADEISRLLDERELSSAQRSMLVVAIYGGLRAGELCALRWEDVDLTRRVLHVRRSRKGPRKNGRATKLLLLEPAAAALTAWRADYQRSDRWSSDGLVWPARDGGMHALGYDSGLAHALKRVGIKRHIRFHDLRHYSALRIIPRADSSVSLPRVRFDRAVADAG